MRLSHLLCRSEFPDLDFPEKKRRSIRLPWSLHGNLMDRLFSPENRCLGFTIKITIISKPDEAFEIDKKEGGWRSKKAQGFDLGI